MKKYLLIVFLFFFAGGSVAADTGQQKKYIRGLLAEAPSYRRDSLVITTFRTFWSEAKGEEEFINQCLEEIGREASLSKWPPAEAHYLYMMGSQYLRQNHLFSAFDYLERALLEFRKLKDEKNVAAVHNKFIPLMAWNMYENEISDESKERYNHYFDEALSAASEGGNIGVIANIRITWAAYTLFILKNYPESLRMAMEVQKLIEEQDKEEWFDYHQITRLGISLNYLYMGEIGKGEKLLEEVVEECLTRPGFNQAQYILGQVAGFGGRYYLSRKNYPKALKYATLAENRVDFMEFPYFSNYLNKTLYEAYKFNGQSDNALKYLEKVRQYEQESKVEKMSYGFAEWQLKYETEKHKNRITTLENENLLKSKQRNRTMVNALLLIITTGFITTLFIVQSNRKLKHKNEELEHKNEEITKAVFKGQAIERKRLASELHDNLNTKIAALKWRVESTENPTPEELGTFVKILDDIYADVRLIAHNLIPTDLEAVGLVVAVQKLIKNLDNHRIEFHFLHQGFTRRLSVNLEYQIYNIVLELINNILKHSQATRAWISLSRIESQVALTVSDNGIGLPVDAKGVGLTNIKSRVEQLKGEITLGDASEKGTAIHILLPAF